MAAGDDMGGEGEQLAQWLKEAGRRAQGAAPARAAREDDDHSFNSPASLHRYLEELAGKPLRSHTEVLAYLAEVAGSQPQVLRMSERRRMVREVSLLLLLALSYLHFYYWEVQLQIASLGSAGILLPQPTQQQQQKKT